MRGDNRGLVGKGRQPPGVIDDKAFEDPGARLVGRAPVSLNSILIKYDIIECNRSSAASCDLAETLAFSKRAQHSTSVILQYLWRFLSVLRQLQRHGGKGLKCRLRPFSSTAMERSLSLLPRGAGDPAMGTVLMIDQSGRIRKDFANAEFDPRRTIHSYFADAVSEYAERPAIFYDDAVTTYAELDHRSNQFARFLASRGVRPGSLVGLFLPRSPDVDDAFGAA